jgi:hypothetical protein
VYRFPVRFDASGDTYDGEVELELAGESASRFEFLSVAQIN